MDRRRFLAAGIAGAAFAGGSPSAMASRPLSGDAAIAAAARMMVERHASRIRSTDVACLVDFSARSALPRLHLVDMIDGRVASFLTAHGRGSDPAHTGMLKHFSNTPGSFATSRGAYETGALYDGKYGRAMRLAGLDPDNSNAEARAIVIHAAWYVSDEMIARHGKLGRSEGCFALSAQGLEQVLARLGPGRLLHAGKFGDAV